jgi:hypothetical protein
VSRKLRLPARRKSIASVSNARDDKITEGLNVPLC